MKTKIVLLMLLLCLGIGVIATQIPAFPLLPKQSALAAPASELTTTAATGFKKAMQQLGALFLNTNGTLNVGENMGDSETEDCDIILSEEVKEDLERAVKYTSLQKGKKYLTPTSEDGLIDDTCVPVEGAKIEKGECTLCYHEPQFQAKRGSVNPFDVGFELQIWKDIYGCNSNTLLSSNLVETRFCAYSHMEDYCDTLREEPTFYEVAFYFNRKTDCLGDYSQEVEIRQIPKLEEGTQLTIAEENYKITKSDKIPFGTKEGFCKVSRNKLNVNCSVSVKLSNNNGQEIGTKPLEFANFEELAIGTYKIEITPPENNIDCADASYSETFTITGYCKDIELTTADNTEASIGKQDGKILVTPSNGTAPFSYTLETAEGKLIRTQTTGQMEDLLAGNYSVTCTDVNNCTGSVSFTIATKCPSFTISGTTIPDNATSDFAEGIINVLASGSVTLNEITYSLYKTTGNQLIDESTSGIFSALVAGEYKVVGKMKDTECTSEVILTVEEKCANFQSPFFTVEPQKINSGGGNKCQFND